MMWICRIASLTIFLVARATSKAVVTDTGFASSDVYVTDDERLAVWEINNGKRAGRLIDGDISFSLGRSAITEGLWPNKRLPYKLGTGLTLKAIAAIELAFQEFRLRTCIDFVLQSTESDYLEIVPLEGCSSYIGLKGGKQQLSIGEGCETISIVIHELMHAIGFYHEHSRFDRDDYVDIISSAIKPGQEHNFKKYDVSQGNPRRVAYDFSSVMQYGGTYFSNDGTTRTMVTRNPAFQDLIGEAYTFSIGDTTKINRMYNCGDTLLYSYHCDFEDEALCGFTNYNRTDGLLWEFHKVGVNITTLSQGIPSLDATYGVTGQGGFMILNASTSAASGQRAEIRSMRYITKSEKQCLYFSHYMANTAQSLGFSINFLSFSRDHFFTVIYHLRSRSSLKQIVWDSLVNWSWRSAQIRYYDDTRYPFVPGKSFTVEVAVEEDKFATFINGDHYFDYQPVGMIISDSQYIQQLVIGIEGNVEIQSIVVLRKL